MPKILLIVDDDGDVLETTRELARVHAPDWIVFTARGPDDSRELLEDLTPQAIIVDYLLPGVWGLNFLQQLTADFPHARLALVTAYKEAVPAKELPEGVRVIRKPLSADDLLRFLEAATIEPRVTGRRSRKG